jgi:hypothetical protein
MECPMKTNGEFRFLAVLVLVSVVLSLALPTTCFCRRQSGDHVRTTYRQRVAMTREDELKETGTFLRC